MNKNVLKLFLEATIGSFLVLSTANLFAQAIAENVLDDVVISKSDFTGIVKIKYRVPVRYVSHSPKKATNEIRIKVDLLAKGNSASSNEEFAIRESIVPQYKQNFGLEEVLFESMGRDNFVTLYFANEVSFEIIQDSSYRSLSIILHGVK